MGPTRRRWLGSRLSLGLGLVWHALARAERSSGLPEPVPVLATAWTDAQGQHWLSALSLDLNEGKISALWRLALPGRAHGLLPLPGGGVLVTANRPGHWLRVASAQGQWQRQLALAPDDPCTLNGHCAVDAARDLIYSSESHSESGQGLIAMRSLATLQRLAQWPSGGVEPHQLLLGEEGLWVANGGIRRGAGDRKTELHRMTSNLSVLNVCSGQVQAQWRLADPRLSLRHLALSPSNAPQPVLGVALQAEHDDAMRRAVAPTLATLDSNRKHLVLQPGDLGGYAGDIAAFSAGFVVRAGALATLHPPEHGGSGVLVATANGASWLAPDAAPKLLSWPQPMALDNHWCLLHAAR